MSSRAVVTTIDAAGRFGTVAAAEADGSSVGGRALCRCRRAVVVAARVGPGTGRSPLLLLFLREQRPENTADRRRRFDPTFNEGISYIRT